MTRTDAHSGFGTLFLDCREPGFTGPGQVGRARGHATAGNSSKGTALAHPRDRPAVHLVRAHPRTASADAVRRPRAAGYRHHARRRGRRGCETLLARLSSPGRSGAEERTMSNRLERASFLPSGGGWCRRARSIARSSEAPSSAGASCAARRSGGAVGRPSGRCGVASRGPWRSCAAPRSVSPAGRMPTTVGRGCAGDVKSFVSGGRGQRFLLTG